MENGHPAAQKDIEEITRLRNEVAEYRAAYEEACAELGRYRAASQETAASSQPDPAESQDRLDTLMSLGDGLHRQARYEEASEVFAQATERWPTHASAWFMLGVDQQALGRLEDAARSFTRFVALQPDETEGYHRLGHVLHSQGRFEEAAFHLKHALIHGPDRLDTWMLLGTALAQIGELDGALCIFGRIVENDRIFAAQHRVFLHQADALSKLGSSEGSVLRLGRHFLAGEDLLGGTDELKIPEREGSDGTDAHPSGSHEPPGALGCDWVLDQLFARIEKIIPADLRGRNVAVFLFNIPKGLGHIITENFHFRSLYRDRADALLVIGPNRAAYDRGGRVALDLGTRDCRYVETDDELILTAAWLNLGIFSRPGRTYALCNVMGLAREYYRHRYGDAGSAISPAYLTLSPQEMEQADRLFSRLGIGPGDKVVAVHAREAGFHRFTVQEHRDVRIENYLPTFEYLLDRGYVVVRLGDPTMTRLPDLGTRLIDLPFLPSYDPSYDPYILSRCGFMISCHSGPCAYARAFNRPVLALNATYSYETVPENRQIIAFKKVCRFGQELNLTSILDEQVFNIRNAAHFRHRHLELREANAEEILQVVEDAVDEFQSQDRPWTACQKKFAAQVQDHAARLGTTALRRRPHIDWLGFAAESSRISDAFCRIHRNYLSPKSD